MASIAPKLELIRSVDALKINPLTRQTGGNGQHIYAYCNIRTNQVIYSLTQVLSPRKNLRQLPEAGNNTKPPKLRKDLWRPLWTLTLPSGSQGEAQGLAAWTRLNALRYMHELYWAPPKELARNHTEEELEEIQEKIEDRGGSKKESVYDVIKREKKKLRLKNVMNQKANSIADLAAVLVEQEDTSAQDAGEYGLAETERMIELDAQARNGALEALGADIERLNNRIKELVKEMPGSEQTETTGNVQTMRKLRSRTRAALRSAQSRKEAMEHALLMVSMGTPQEGEHSSRDIEATQNEANKASADVPDMWMERSIKILRKLTTHYVLASTKERVANGEVDLAKRAREILLPDGINGAAETSEEVQQERLSILRGMIRSNERKLREMGLKPGQRLLFRTEDPTETSLERTPEQKQLAREYRFWSHMASAYEQTNGTLQVRNKNTGEVVNLGEDFRDTSQDVSADKYQEQTVNEAPKEIEEDDTPPRQDPSSAISQVQETNPGLRFNSQQAQPRKRQSLRIPRPSFSMEGVKVTWQNILDAEFAPAWPPSVEHDWMGITRHAAPKPGAEPSMTAQEYYQSKRREKVVQEKEEVNMREEVVKSVTSAIVRELIGRRKDGQLKERRRSSVKKGEVGENRISQRQEEQQV